MNFKIVFDADLIVNLEEQSKESEIQRDKLSAMIEKKFMTDTGKRLASETLLGEER